MSRSDAKLQRGIIVKIVFMGTPDFAAETLRALLVAGHEITAVVTQPDRPKGRSKTPQFSPVKELAVAEGLYVLQPVRIKKPEEVARLREPEADVIVVAAYGQILSKEILEIPRLGCLNVHASLLPRYRGASPIQHVILAGESVTGITIQQMDEGLDTGDILLQKELKVDHSDTYGCLSEKLAVRGGETIVEALSLAEKELLRPVKQDDQEASYAPLIRKEMGRVDFTAEAASIARLVRGLNPWPGTYCMWKDKQLKIWEAHDESGTSGKPGEILEIRSDCLVVATGKGSLAIYEMQLEGKRRMKAKDFLIGGGMKLGDILI
jgi:methionyl-tRNA formyltransferase